MKRTVISTACGNDGGRPRSTPAAETDLSWAVHDPDGFKVQIAPELMTPGHPMFEKAVGGIAMRQAQPPAKKD